MKMSAKIKRLSIIGLFCALAYICVLFFHINVQFLTFEIKDAVITIGAMFFGPLSALVLSLIVSLLELVTISETGIYGFLMNFLATAAFTLPASLIYKYRRKMSGAIIGLMTAIVAMTVVMLAANLVITPYYMGVSREAVEGLILPLLLPFNLTKAVLNAAIVLLLYKPVSQALKKSGFCMLTPGKKSCEIDRENTNVSVSPIITKRFVPVAIISILLIIASIAMFFLFLNGTFQLH